MDLLLGSPVHISESVCSTKVKIKSLPKYRGGINIKNQLISYLGIISLESAITQSAHAFASSGLAANFIPISVDLFDQSCILVESSCSLAGSFMPALYSAMKAA